MPRPLDPNDRYDARPDPDDDWTSRQPGGNTFGFQRGRGAAYAQRRLVPGWYGQPMSPEPQAPEAHRGESDTGFHDRFYGREPGFGPGMHWRNTPTGFGQDNHRGFLERAGDELASWFGDEYAKRRRDQDYRGVGPKGYVRSDDRVREDVCDRLSDHPLIDASDIEVAAAAGEVTLTGGVSSRAAKRTAEDCAERVSGVTHVQNNLRIRPDDTAGILPPRSTPL